MNLFTYCFRTPGGNNSKFCESSVSSPESLFMVISCRLNVSLKSNLVVGFDLDGKNGDDTSSSSLFRESERRKKELISIIRPPRLRLLHSSHGASPDFRFIFNEWNTLLVSWYWKPINRYHTIRFVQLQQREEAEKS